MVTLIVPSVVGMTAPLINPLEHAAVTQTARVSTATDRAMTGTPERDRVGIRTLEIARAPTEAATNVRLTLADRRSDRATDRVLTAVGLTGPPAHPARRLAGIVTNRTVAAAAIPAPVSTVMNGPARLTQISVGPATTTGNRISPTKDLALTGKNAPIHRVSDHHLTATTEPNHAMAMRGLTVIGLPVREVHLSDHPSSVGTIRTVKPVIIRVPDRIVPGHSIGTTTEVTAVPIQHVPITTAAERVVPTGADQTNQPVRRTASNG